MEKIYTGSLIAAALIGYGGVAQAQEACQSDIDALEDRLESEEVRDELAQSIQDLLNQAEGAEDCAQIVASAESALNAGLEQDAVAGEAAGEVESFATSAPELSETPDISDTTDASDDADLQADADVEADVDTEAELAEVNGEADVELEEADIDVQSEPVAQADVPAEAEAELDVDVAEPEIEVTAEAERPEVEDASVAADDTLAQPEAGLSDDGRVAAEIDDEQYEDSQFGSDEEAGADEFEHEEPAVADTSLDQSQTMPTAMLTEQQALDLVGETLEYTSDEDIGEIDELIRGADGTLYFTVEIGGFLGIGEEEKAIPVSAIQLNAEGEPVLNMSEEEFEALPTFEEGDYQEVELAD